MGPINLMQTGCTFMAMNMQDKLTNKGHLFFSVSYLTKLIQQFYLSHHTIHFRIFKANFFGFSLTWRRQGWIYNNKFSLFDSIFVESLSFKCICNIIFVGKMEIKIRWLQKKMKFLSFFYLLYNIQLSWLDSFWCLIFVEFDRNECFQIWHKVLLIDFTMSLFMDSTELWNSDFKGIHF